MADVMDCDPEVIEFKLQSCYNVHFRTNTIGKVMKPLISPMYGFNSVVLPT